MSNWFGKNLNLFLKKPKIDKYFYKIIIIIIIIVVVVAAATTVLI
jgi:hypothetical protein